MVKAADWMLAKEVRHKGDWQSSSHTEAAVLRVQQRVYPDTDDTAQVLLR